MTDREAFIEAIAAAPEDDTPRLAFADWLDEHGEGTRAEFVRLQCGFVGAFENDPWGEAPETARRLERIRELFGLHWPQWLAPLCAAFGQEPPKFPRERGVMGRLWERVRRGGRGPDILDYFRKPRFYGPLVDVPFDPEEPDAVRLPLVCGELDRGFFNRLSVRAPASGLPDALRIEPVSSVSMEFPDPERDWDRAAGPHLRRLQRFAPTFPADKDVPPDAPLARLFDSDDLAGVTELELAPPVCGFPRWDTVPASWVRLLVRSRMGRRLERLSVETNAEGLAELAGLPEDSRLATLGFHRPAGRAPTPGVGRVLERLPWRARLVRLWVTALYHTPGELDGLSEGGAWPRLESLAWCHNGAGDDEAEALARSTAFPALTELDLTGNHLTDRGACALAAAPFLRRLRKLSLGSQSITSAGAVALAEALAGGALERLVLYANRVSRSGRRRVREILGPKVFVWA